MTDEPDEPDQPDPPIDADEFGDVDPDDAYTDGADPDPEQVAHRLHELRSWLAERGGDELPGWDELAADEQDVAVALGAHLIAAIAADSSIDTVAEALHEARTYLAGQGGAMTAEEVAVGDALCSAVVDWLRHEGTIP